MDTENRYKHLRQLTDSFLSQSIRSQDPAGLCFSTSFPLLIYLAIKGIKCDLRKGEVAKLESDGTTRNTTHYWLQLHSEDIIIDPTYTQFIINKNVEPIYIGKLKDCEVMYKQGDDEWDTWFPNDFDGWKTPYEDIDFPLDGLFWKRSITYSMRLATILYAEIKQLSSPNMIVNEYFGVYFKPVFIFLNNWYAGNINFELAKVELTNSFDDLLSDALKWGREELEKQNSI